MRDTGLTINVVKRTIVNTSDLEQVLVLGDNNSQYITFSMLDNFDEIDVLMKNIFIKFINAAGFGDKVAAVDVTRIPDVGDAPDTITFGWIIPQLVTAKTGTVSFAVEILGVDYKWSTIDALLIVEKTVDLTNALIIPDQTWLDAYEQNLVTSTGIAADSAVAAKASEDNAKASEIIVEASEIIVEALHNELLPALTQYSGAEVILARKGEADLSTKIGMIDTQLANIPKYCIPTGTADDTSYLQNIIDTYFSVILKAGTYLIDGQNRLQIPSNRTIVFEAGAILQIITNNDDDYYAMHMLNVTDITITNPIIIGDNITHTGITGESGHCMGIAGTSKNIKITNPTFKNGWGDGLYVSNGEDIIIDNLICDSNRRNGLTITSGKNIFINNPQCINQNGTSPEAGIDIEPNDDTAILENIVISNPFTSGNTGTGITIALAQLLASTKNIIITIENHRDFGSARGFAIDNLAYSATGKLDGEIKNINPNYEENTHQGILITDYSSQNTPIIKIINPTILNCNANAGSSPRYYSAIVLLRETAATTTNKIGNVQIINPIIKDTRAVSCFRNGIYTADDKLVYFEKVNIIDPLEIVGIANVKEFINIDKGITIIDNLKVLTVEYTTNTTIGEAALTRIHNAGAAGLVTYTLNQPQVLDQITTFEDVAGTGIRIVPQATERIRPLATGDGKYLESTLRGCSITLKRINATTWHVQNIVGTWTAEA